MKTFRIAKKTNEVVSTTTLDFISGGISGNDLYIVVSKDKGLDLSEGGKLVFEKTASGNSGEMMKVYEENTEIKKIVADGDYLYVYFEYIYINPLILTSYRKIVSPEGYQYKLYFGGEHHMLPCDLSDEYKVYIRRGDKVINFTGLALCFPNELVKGEDRIPAGGECCNETAYRFNFETMERNSILAKELSVTSSGDTFEPAPGDQVLFATNPFFHINESGETIFYGCDGEIVSILKYTDFMSLEVGMEQDYDAKRMFQEYQVNELFVNKVKSSIIPGFIDLEKVKYAPAFSGESIYLATGLTFNLHFRTRVSGATKYDFEDTWHFNDSLDTWNGNNLNNVVERGQLYNNEKFVNSSNLLGYLGFTDDDVYNQKNRLKQSFIRLSFYDSKNPLTQSLLCYSTIFIDSGDLFGKYIKRKAWLEEKITNYSQDDYPVVWSSAGTKDPCDAVTCQLIVNDEYDTTRSGEGFNIYLFKEDAPVENYPQDIYMKIEFNHAGYGRTVPLIYWPKDAENGKPIKLTTQNYLDNLYVRIRVSKSDKGYVYDFPDAKEERDNGIVWENERLTLNLFEPMIEPER